MRKDQSRSIKTCSGFGNNDQRAVSPLYIPSKFHPIYYVDSGKALLDQVLSYVIKKILSPNAKFLWLLEKSHK